MSEPLDTLVPDWPAPPNVRALATTRKIGGASAPPFDRFNLGSRCGDAADAVAANRAALIARCGLPSTPRWLRQVHGVEVLDADMSPRGEPEADAAVTRTPGVVLAVLTADCLPVLLAAGDGSAVGIAHAGWRGLAAGVVEATLARLGVESANVIAWLGPAIGARSYEVGAEVRAAFVAADARAAAAFEATRAGHWRCDLEALARLRLAAAGVARVHGGGFDTFTDPRFYSFRRERDTGRFASLIWIEPATADEDAPGDVAAAESASLFPRVMGEAFARLPPRVRALHRRGGTHRWRGVARVTRGRGWLSRLVGWSAGLPGAAAQTPIDVEIACAADGETWTRRFGAQAMRSVLWRDGELLRERLGPVTFGFALGADGGGLRWSVREAHMLGIPLPARWFSGVSAHESERDGRYRFEAKARLPLAGEVVHYEGWLADG